MSHIKCLSIVLLLVLSCVTTPALAHPVTFSLNPTRSHAVVCEPSGAFALLFGAAAGRVFMQGDMTFDFDDAAPVPATGTSPFALVDIDLRSVAPATAGDVTLDFFTASSEGVPPSSGFTSAGTPPDPDTLTVDLPSLAPRPAHLRELLAPVLGDPS